MSSDQPKLHRVAHDGPISFLFGLLICLFLLTAWFDECRQSLLQVADRGGSTLADARHRFNNLENAGGFGIVAGLAFAFLVWHPRRVLGLVPIAGTAWLGTLVLLLNGWANRPLAFTCGLTAGLAAWPFMMTLLRRAGLTGPYPGGDRLWLLVMGPVGLIAGLYLRTWLAEQPDSLRDNLLLGTSIFAVVVAWWLYLLHALELLLEILLLPCYRFRFVGPGVPAIPAQGPVLLLANHSCMFDPLFVGKVAPRRLIPVMTAKYYDLPVLRFLMKWVVGTIRVPVAERRREAPELATIVDALDKGHCLLMFPEGKLRREGDPELSYFNQGVWHVLRARPNTPVVCCWIENAWGSYLSYANGPPGKNKPFDWLRPIDLAVATPEVLTEELLATHAATRRYLTDRVADLKALVAGRPARQHHVPDTPAETAVPTEATQ